MKKKQALLTMLIVIITVSLASASTYSLDISELKNKEYNLGQDLTFKIILLENKIPISEPVNYTITDSLRKKEITGTVNSNEERTLKIENDFIGGIWTITANYEDNQVKRTFIIGENPEIEFSIKEDELIIKNTGNVRYTKTIQVKIGDEIDTYAQNIKAGEEKTLKLISSDGKYNIEVTDGETTIRKKNVQLFGTGNVVGAVDKNLVGYTGFAGANDLAKSDNKDVSLSKVPLSLVFIALIGILTALAFIEKKLTKKK